MGLPMATPRSTMRVRVPDSLQLLALSVSRAQNKREKAIPHQKVQRVIDMRIEACINPRGRLKKGRTQPPPKKRACKGLFLALKEMGSATPLICIIRAVASSRAQLALLVLTLCPLGTKPSASTCVCHMMKQSSFMYMHN